MPEQAGNILVWNESDDASFLRAILDAADIGTAILDPEGRILLWTAGLVRITGIGSSQAEGQSIEELASGRCIRQLANLVRDTAADGVARIVPPNVLRSLSSTAELSLHGLVRRAEDAGLGAASILQIVDLAEAEPSGHDWVIAMLDAVPDNVSVIDGEGRWLFANRRMKELFALPEDGLAGHTLEDVVALAGQNKALFGAAFTYTRSAWAVGKQISREETVTHDGGADHLYQFVQIPLFRKNKHRKGMITILRDLTDSRETAARIEFLAHHDSLTRLPNRVLFRDRLKSAIALARRTGDQIGLCLLDLSRFREINETMGHHIGDELLRQVGERLIERARDSDTIARLSADEFGVILTQLRSEDGAATAAEGLLQTMDASFMVDGNQIGLSSCIGMSMYPTDSTDPDELLKHADIALSRAKLIGPNTYSFFVAGMNEEVQIRRLLENDLRRALSEKQLELYYQPQTDSRTGEICGVESLVRWRHPERGLLAPGLFISIAERTGLIMPIGDWILDQAANQARIWAEEGIFSGTMAVNLSPAQFNNKDTLSIILGSLERSGVDPKMMQIEIVESMAMSDIDATIDVLHQLREIGLSISIDDFGTGYSSLNYLKKLPVDKMKIDRSFVVDIGVHSGNEAIITAIVDLGHSLGMKVNVEGIETESQLEFLKQAGVDELQGYLVGRPMAAEDMATLLRARRN